MVLRYMTMTAPRWLAVLFLALLHTAIAADKSAADYYVRDLPGLPKDGPPIKMHAGHMEITPEHNGNLFFWHFQNQHIANRQRTVIWINGGPGCSSEDGALMEIGPYRVKDENTLTLNNGSWHEFANLLFVDNPVGTGYSYVDTDSYVKELTQMADQFVQFLEKFFTIFPEYNRDDIYLSGESYAGQHIPYIARAILDRNKNKPGDAWSLSGLLIGNGWISPKDQYSSYIKFAFEKGLIKKDSADGKRLIQKQADCDALVGPHPSRVDYPECEEILSSILMLTRKDGGGKDACYNMYDVRLRDSYPSCGMNWPPDLVHVGPYLRKKSVIEALHVSTERNTGWEECKGAVGAAFRGTKAPPSIDLLPDLVKEVPLLLFSGGEDLICNHIGTEQLISNLEWNGGKGFEVMPGNWAPRREWTFEGEKAGFWQEARNLTYVHFFNASHMVPFDWPRRTRDMLDRFMGVDISSIGGEPTDSRIDGEKGPETTVGGASNSTKANEEVVKEKLNEAKWAAYQRSGEIVLVFVVIGAIGFGLFVWRQRRSIALYTALSGEDKSSAKANGKRRVAFRRNLTDDDLEASAAFADGPDDIALENTSRSEDAKYSVGDDSDDDVVDSKKDDGRGKSKASLS